MVRPAHVCRGHGVRLLQRLAMHSVADTVCFDPRLHGVRVVSDRVRGGGAGDSLLWVGGVEGLNTLVEVYAAA